MFVLLDIKKWGCYKQQWWDTFAASFPETHRDDHTVAGFLESWDTLGSTTLLDVCNSEHNSEHNDTCSKLWFLLSWKPCFKGFEPHLIRIRGIVLNIAEVNIAKLDEMFGHELAYRTLPHEPLMPDTSQKGGISWSIAYRLHPTSTGIKPMIAWFGLVL